MVEMYSKSLSEEWIDWVEKSNPNGTREKEIFPFIKSWLQKIKPKHIADIGCGQGSCSQFVDDSIKYIGIDPSPTLIKRAKKLFSSSNKTFVEGDAYNLPLKDKEVDAVMSIWVWSHIENLEKAAKEMYRVLRSGGRFLIITSNPDTYDERKTFYKDYSIKGNLLTGNFDLGNGKYLTDTTLYLHTKSRIIQSIEEAGFKIENVGQMGDAETSDNGLYLVIQGVKK